MNSFQKMFGVEFVLKVKNISNHAVHIPGFGFIMPGEIVDLDEKLVKKFPELEPLEKIKLTKSRKR